MTGIDFFAIGIVGGLTPGPMTALLLGETLRHGRRRGMTIPLAMIFSNSCFSAMALLLVSSGLDLAELIAPLQVSGALLLFLFAVQDWRSADRPLELPSGAHVGLFGKSLMLEFCNPHPYLFWGTVLAPGLLLTWKASAMMKLFQLCFLFVLGLVGTKVLMVLFADSMRAVLSGPKKILISRALAVLLFAFGLKLLLF